MNRLNTRRLITLLCASGWLGASSQVFASSFQLWEQDGASIGNYHAGYAAEAADASTAWYNPAGITRFKNQQIVLGGNAILTDFKYKGSVTVQNNIPGVPPELQTANFPYVTAQGGQFAFIPFLHYVAPINERLGFGFSVDAPFGLKTDYGISTPLRYAATLTSVTVVDVSPSLGFKITDKASIGAGFDIQRMFAEFDNVGMSVLSLPVNTDTTSTNKANDTGYGFHAGVLYEFNENNRVGLSYHSQVVHHLSGSSQFEGPLATELNGGPMRSHASTSIRLPAYTALSAFSHVIPQVSVMATVLYTQWDNFRNLTLKGISGVVPDPDILIAPSTSITATIPEFYRNTWNVSLGADYYATDTFTLRTGIGYDQTPLRSAYRNVQLPDNDRFVAALGGHFQATKAVGVDLGWMHLFINHASIHPPAQVTGAQITSTSGTVKGGADVIGGQVVWDIV